jgi:lipid A 3-O-deacylase
LTIDARRTTGSLAALLLIVASSAVPGAAQSVRSFGLSADNDGLVFWVPPDRREDRYYTHSLRAEAVVAWEPPWARLLGGGAARVCGAEPASGSCTVTRLVLGQEIYTPDFIFDKDPESHDRPFAGLLYVAAAAVRLAPHRSSSLGLQVGVTGKASFAAPFHRWFHRSLDKHEPMGWEHQIPFEPAFLLRYETRGAVSLIPPGKALSLRLEPHGGATLGTLRTGASGGVVLGGGWNAPFFDGLREVGAGPFSLRVGVGVEGEVVARDLFLDGSTWTSSVRATREAFVGRLRSRFAVGWGRLALEWATTHSTLEFRDQRGRHTYATIRVRVYR